MPSVNYGMYTYEGDAAIAAQLPALIQGAPVDKLLDAIHQQLSAQIQEASKSSQCCCAAR